MLQEKVFIKQIPDEYAEATGLAAYNRSRMPRCVDKLSPALNTDGRYITGIDEESLAINMLPDQVVKANKKEEIRTLRLSLEAQTGLDLSGTSPFWSNYSVELKSDSEMVLLQTNPHDVIKYSVLISNNYVAPSKEEAGNPKYKDSKYFAFYTESAQKDKVTNRKIRDKARAELLKIADKKDTMLLLGQYLEGSKYVKSLDTDTLYDMLSDFIEKSASNVEKFNRAVALDRSDLQFRITVDRAIKRKIIQMNNKIFQHGQVSLGSTVDEVINTLKTPEFASEFLFIKEELGDK